MDGEDEECAHETTKFFVPLFRQWSMDDWFKSLSTDNPRITWRYLHMYNQFHYASDHDNERTRSLEFLKPYVHLPEDLLAWKFPDLPRNLSPQKKVIKFEEIQSDIPACVEVKVLISPLILYLHVDMGIANGVYQPFASPRCNNRKIHPDGVTQIRQSMEQNVKGKGGVPFGEIVAQEDFSVFPYATRPKKMTGNEVLYRSVANQDKNDHLNVIENRVAVAVTSEHISEMYSMVSTYVWARHEETRCGKHLTVVCLELQILQIDLEEAEKSLPIEELVVKYLMDLDKFCDVNFDELKSYVSWQ